MFRRRIGEIPPRTSNILVAAFFQQTAPEIPKECWEEYNKGWDEGVRQALESFLKEISDNNEFYGMYIYYQFITIKREVGNGLFTDAGRFWT